MVSLLTRARALTMDIEDFLAAVNEVVIIGESRKKGSELLTAASNTILELHMAQDERASPVMLFLRQTKVRLSKRLAESDSIAAAASPPPSSAAHGDGGRRSRRSDALHAITLAQIKFEMDRLTEDTLCDVSTGANVQADKLRDIARTTVPDVRKTVDRLRDGIKNHANCDEPEVATLVRAQQRCEAALQWITQVEKRMQVEQIYLDQKQPDRKVDFEPFASGQAVSIYEFFQKFEAWARGRLSMDTMANVLYTKHLDKTITHGNKELEEIKLSYSSMKAWLFRMYGRPDTVADLYLNNIRKVKPPTSKSDVAGECRQVKEVYGHIITLTTLEESEGKPVESLVEHIYRNQFLKALVAVLPKTTRSQFMLKLEDEDLHVISGRRYVRDIIALLKNEYRRLEMETEIDATERGNKPSSKSVSVHQVVVGVSSSSNSDSEDEPVPVQFSSSKEPKKPRKAGGVQSVNHAAAQSRPQPQQTVAPPRSQQVVQSRPQQQAAPQPVVPQPGIVAPPQPAQQRQQPPQQGQQRGHRQPNLSPVSYTHLTLPTTPYV